MKGIKKELHNYFNWSCNALLGGNPVGADNFLKLHFEEIKEVAQVLLMGIEYIPSKVYRGVILRETIDELKPHPNFTYVSFSEDKNIAEAFADTSEEGFGSVFYLGDYGYIIEHEPKLEEILFHWRFIELLPYEKAFKRAGFTDPLFRKQKEVTIIQPDNPLKAIPYGNVHTLCSSKGQSGE